MGKGEEGGKLGEVVGVGGEEKEESGGGEIGRVKGDMEWEGVLGNLGGVVEEEVGGRVGKVGKYGGWEE